MKIIYEIRHCCVKNKLFSVMLIVNCHVAYVHRVSSQQTHNVKTTTYQRRCDDITFHDVDVIDKGFFSEAFLFKPRGGRSPPERFKQKAEEECFI